MRRFAPDVTRFESTHTSVGAATMITEVLVDRLGTGPVGMEPAIRSRGPAPSPEAKPHEAEVPRVRRGKVGRRVKARPCRSDEASSAAARPEDDPGRDVGRTMAILSGWFFPTPRR
ncbi:MAG: hypothetical protein ACR2HV_11430 [Acidimicrobiales bacterium]